MKLIFLNIKNLLPYLILIVIYFFFINLEATKEQQKKGSIFFEKETYVENSNNKDIDLRISMPVIPYGQ